MKRNEIALLILIVGLCAGAGYLVGQSFFGKNVTRPVKIETAQPISPNVDQPSSAIFNETAINPTVPVTIGTVNSSQTPFDN